MFASHLHNLKLSSPEVLSLLNILVFWDPDRIEFETVKMGTQSLHSLFEAIKKPSKWNKIGIGHDILHRVLSGSLILGSLSATETLRQMLQH